MSHTLHQRGRFLESWIVPLDGEKWCWRQQPAPGMVPPHLQIPFSSPEADFAASESRSQTLGVPKLVLDYRSLEYLSKTLISLSMKVESLVPNKLL